MIKIGENESSIKTERLNITGNIMTWSGTMIQLSNISYITTSNLIPEKFPWIAAFMIAGGIFFFSAQALLAIFLALAGGIWIYFWYQKNLENESQVFLTIMMNSGSQLQFLLQDKSFLNDVLCLLEKVIVSGGTGAQNIVINVSDCTLSGNSKLLDNFKAH